MQEKNPVIFVYHDYRSKCPNSKKTPLPLKIPGYAPVISQGLFLRRKDGGSALPYIFPLFSFLNYTYLLTDPTSRWRSTNKLWHIISKMNTIKVQCTKMKTGFIRRLTQWVYHQILQQRRGGPSYPWQIWASSIIIFHLNLEI